VDEAEVAREACARRMTERRADTAMKNGNYGNGSQYLDKTWRKRARRPAQSPRGNWLLRNAAAK
jgi:hypothetical protein